MIVEQHPVLIVAAHRDFDGEFLLVERKALRIERGGEFRARALHQFHPAVGVNPERGSAECGGPDGIGQFRLGRPHRSELRFRRGVLEVVERGAVLFRISQTRVGPPEPQIHRGGAGSIVFIDGGDVLEAKSGSNDDRQTAAERQRRRRFRKSGDRRHCNHRRRSSEQRHPDAAHGGFLHYFSFSSDALSRS